MIITFYSYKGGCGRTMALANLAVLLAAEKKTVLAVDFDLEAPGLWRYFSDFDSTVAEQSGLLDLICAQADHSDADHSDAPHWQDYVRKVDFPGGTLSLLTSGKLDENYATRVLGLDWDSFFRKAEGGEFFEMLRSDWRSKYDYVLIDSRTGVTDAGGICTIQLPDMIIPVCVSNYQSIEGAADVIASAQIARKNLAYDRPPALVMPLLSRFDSRTEYESARKWLDIAADRLSQFYYDWLPKSITARQALEWTKLPYVAYFSFGENLPVLASELSDPDSLGYAFKRLTSLIRSDLADIRTLLSSELPEQGLPIDSASWDFFVSYTQSDQAWAEWIAWNLEEDGYRVLVQAWDLVPGSNWTQSLRNGTSRAARTLVVLSQDYLQSVYGTAEWQASLGLDSDWAKRKLIPVRVADCERPGLLASTVGIDLFARSEEQAKADLHRGIAKTNLGRGKPTFEPGFRGGGRAVADPPQFPGTMPAKRRVSPSKPDLTGRDDGLRAREHGAYDFDVYISYSRQDEAVAAGIQKGLHRIGRRMGQLRALRVFRDNTDLDITPDLWGKATEAMDRSRWLIVVLSRRAAASHWVNREVAHWLEHRGVEHLMLVVAEGHLHWDSQNGRLDPFGSDVALPVLTEPGVFRTEPSYIDVSGDAPWDSSTGTFRDKVTYLAAPIHGNSEYELTSGDVREQRRFRRLRLAAIIALVIVTLVALVTAMIAFQQRQELLRQREEGVQQRSEAQSTLTGARTAGDVQARQDLDVTDALAVADRCGPVTIRDPAETFAVFTSPLCLGCSQRLFQGC